MCGRTWFNIIAATGAFLIFSAAAGASGDPASNPDPCDGQGCVDPGVVLKWSAGEGALWHDVYFGTDFNDVNDANITSDAFQVRQEPNNWDCHNYDANGLAENITFHWRIDEVNDSNIYKGEVWSFTTASLWENQLVFADDCLIEPGTSAANPGWAKFTIKLDEPNTIYYQNSRIYTFHYDYATELLEPFIGMTVPEFFDVTLYDPNQLAVLGAVIIPPLTGQPPEPAFDEYGIQFIRYDPYTKEDVRDMFNAVKATVIADPCVQAFYFPTYEQMETAIINRNWFESQGIIVSSTARWWDGNVCYSPGWALGELKYFPGDQIEAAYLAGDLRPDDILLTDGVPAEIPFVAGIFTLSPSTPNSHVAILARTYGVPFVHVAVAEDATQLQELLGKLTLICVDDDDGLCQLKIADAENAYSQQEIAEMLALKELPPLDISPMAAYGGYSESTDGLLPSDIQYFGGKASNYGILRASIPNDCPVALAISFDLWNEFMEQELLNGKTLREEIAFRLSGYSYPPSNMALLSAELETIREDLFKNKYVTVFTQAQTDAIIAALQDPNYGFDPNEKIRFRSSTNVEDSDQFTGAGLYDSYSGCLADELDGDELGPCLCDAEKNNERGVFRAIRKVFASFYNGNAYLERLRYGVNENEVGMAVLVHHSFPDEFELANGVATLEKNSSANTYDIKLVTQDGAVSVANPIDGSIPEEVDVYVDSSGDIYISFVRSSNLVILGEKVMEWTQDYNDLCVLLLAAADEFEQATGKTDYVLDFEYKKMAPGGAAMPAGGLVVKQIRQIPEPDPVSVTCPSPEICLPLFPSDFCVERIFEDGNGISIRTSYCLEITFDFISPFRNWCQTVIQGYTTRSIFLYGAGNQSYSPSHHNWCEDFIFTPTLEPGMDQCTLNQLRAQDIARIHLSRMTFCGEPYITLEGFGTGPFYMADIAQDDKVNTRDFAKFANWWLETECDQCGGADLDCDSQVGGTDLVEFAANWLQGTEENAPTPDPMTWAGVPLATSSSTVTMTATTASDESGVEYYFECTAGGGHDSGWQNGAEYEDTGLAPLTEYTYRVKAQDKSPQLNETGWSLEESCTTLDPNVAVAHWTLDDGGGSVAADSVGGNDGTLYGNPAWVTGEVGTGALEFDGSGDYVEVPDTAALDFEAGQDFSISLWFRIDAASAGNAVNIFNKREDSGAYQGILIFYEGRSEQANYRKVSFTLDLGSAYASVVSDSNVDDGGWHHLVLLRSGLTLRMYIDSVQEGGDSTAAGNDADLSSSNSVKFGTNRNASTFFGGALDEIIVYRKALSWNDVQQLYQDGLNN